MNTLQINLGMGNNPFSNEEVVDYFAVKKNYRLMAYRFQDKTFNGEVEETFVAMLEVMSDLDAQSQVLEDVEYWCKVFEQESIALSTPHMEVLAFNASYGGEPYRFDSNLFEYIKI